MKVPSRHPPAPHHLLSPGADDHPLGVELGNRHVGAGVVEFAVDLVGQQNDPIPSRDRRQSSELVGAIGVACGVVRIVQDDEARPLGVGLAEPLEIVRPHVPVVRRRRVDPADGPSDDPRLRRIRDPAGCRDDEVPVVHQLEQEHELLGARANQHVLRMAHDAVAAMVVSSHGLPKRSQPAYRQVLLAVGVVAKGLHHGLGYGKRRLAQAQVEDLSVPLGRARRRVRSWPGRPTTTTRAR